MKHPSSLFAIASLIILVCSCAPVKFYSDSALTMPGGLKYYTVKPYLLAERELAGNNIIKVTPVYLPDLENPQYMIIKDGPGSRKVDLKLADGAISTFGMASDTKISESVESLAALISKSASAITDLTTLKGIPQAASVQTVTELYEVVMTGGKTSVRRIDIP